MTADLHYSPAALVLRSGWMLLAAVVVLGDFLAHAHGGFPHVFGLGFVPSAVLIATALYCVGMTMVLTLGLIRHGGVALAETEQGIFVHSAWFSKSLSWADIARIALEVRYVKGNHFMLVMVHEKSGPFRRHAIDARLLAETVDRAGDWVDAAERKRVARGGAPYIAPTSGLAGYNARTHAADIAADLAAARASRTI